MRCVGQGASGTVPNTSLSAYYLEASRFSGLATALGKGPLLDFAVQDSNVPLASNMATESRLMMARFL